jgi:chromosome segregation ATPase
MALLAEREAELASLERQLASMGAVLPRKTREAEAVQREIAGLERKRNEVVAQAKEAQRKKREGESDGLDETGRWYRGVEKSLNALVGAGS